MDFQIVASLLGALSLAFGNLIEGEGMGAAVGQHPSQVVAIAISFAPLVFELDPNNQNLSGGDPGKIPGLEAHQDLVSYLLPRGKVAIGLGIGEVTDDEITNRSFHNLPTIADRDIASRSLPKVFEGKLLFGTTLKFYVAAIHRAHELNIGSQLLGHGPPGFGQSIFRSLGGPPGFRNAVGGMQGCLPRVPSGECCGEKGEKAYSGTADPKPKSGCGPIGRFIGGIGGLPLSAQIGLAVVLTLTASGVAVIGFWRALERRGDWRERGLCAAIAVGLFGIYALIWL